MKFHQYYKEKWNAELGLQAEDLDWGFIHRHIFLTSNDTKLRWFQFRIVHRIIATNRYLSVIRIQNDSSCSFCKQDDETIMHLFHDCVIVNDFFVSFENWIYDRTSILLNFSKTEVLFGKKKCYDARNFLILIYKHYIYRQRCRKEQLYLPNLKTEIYNQYIIEKYNSNINGKQNSFLKKWSNFENLFVADQ